MSLIMTLGNFILLMLVVHKSVVWCVSINGVVWYGVSAIDVYISISTDQ